MKVITDFNFKKKSIKKFLKIEDSNEEITNYESFMLINPITKNEYPEFDKPFFDRMNATLKHIIYKFENGWITSERQVMLTGNECLTTIQFVPREDRVQLNVFQRSSNVNNLADDIQFLNWFLVNEIKKSFELNVFVSMPHEFHKKKTKVD